MSRANFNYKSLRFPREVGSNEVPNFVLFTPVKLEYGKFDSNFRNKYGNTFETKDLTGGDFGGSGYTNPIAQVRSGFGGIVSNLANGALSALKSVVAGNVNLTGNFDLFGGKINARVDIGNLGLKESGVQGSSKVTSKAGICLYMPPGIAHSLGAKYSAQELGAIGVTALGMESINTMMTNGIFTAEMADAFMNDAASFGAGAVADKVRKNSFASSVVQRGTGRVINSYSYQMFGGMEHRSFSYSFKMVARSNEDSNVIKDVCDQFMEYMLPVKDTQNDFHLYDIPHMWDISYHRYDAENRFMDQPNRCFLQSCDISYAGDQAMGFTHNDGAPLSVNLTLKFVEVEPMFSSGGGNSGLGFSKDGNPFARADQDARSYRGGNGNFSGGAG